MNLYKVTVVGRVQGVNFRYNVKTFAERNGLKGNVKNLKDGDVEILVKCTTNELDGFIKWLKLNPGFSKVVEVRAEKIGGNIRFTGFEIVKEANLLKDKGESFKNFAKKLFQFE